MNVSALPQAHARWRRLALRAPWVVLPCLILGFQMSARMLAEALRGAPFNSAWLSAAAFSPWLWLAIACEAGSLCIWMTILSETTLSAAFPMTSFAYVLVIGVSWAALGESFSCLYAVGTVCILCGVYLIGREPREATK